MNIVIRKYQAPDCKELAGLFYHTVHTVNAKDYTKEQMDAWASGTVDLEKWHRPFMEHDTLVALDGEKIVGFGDTDKTGYLDRLYVHPDYQGKGIAAAICGQLEKMVQGNLTTHASGTARPFLKSGGIKSSKSSRLSVMASFLPTSSWSGKEPFRIDRIRRIRATGGRAAARRYVCFSSLRIFGHGAFSTMGRYRSNCPGAGRQCCGRLSPPV